MKVIVLFKANPSFEAGEMPNEQYLTEMGQYNEQLIAAGVLKSGEGLRPSSAGVRVRLGSTNRSVIDGPFAETKELVAGFLVWEVRSMQEAIEWVKRCPNPTSAETDVEIRTVYDIDDYAANDTTGVFAPKERELYAKIENMSADEAEIRYIIHEWSRALEAKDLDRLFKDYAPDAILYDAVPPYKTVGVENIRQAWANCLPYFPETFQSEHRDIQIHVAGDTAFMHGVHHFIPTPADDPIGQNWLRVTVGYRKIEGKWKVIHEHISTPFNPMNSQAWMIKNPDVVDMPDYGSAT